MPKLNLAEKHSSVNFISRDTDGYRIDNVHDNTGKKTRLLCAIKTDQSINARFYL